MSNMYTSKYPTIVSDKSLNSPNDGMIKKITVEEYYDLKHHTHSISDLSTDEGNMSYDEMQVVINNLTEITNAYDTTIKEQQNLITQLRESNTTLQNTVNELTETVNNTGDTILHQNDIIQRLEADITEFKALIATQNETIDVMKKEMINMTTVSDWDVEKPGNQDIEGNDLGTFMGYTVTEIN